MKEKMIEFVREKIILANNQECKTFEEALNKELKNPQCLIKYKSSENNYDISSIKEFTTNMMFYNVIQNEAIDRKNIMSIFSDKDLQKQIHNQLQVILDLKLKNDDLIILGLPLNLERILVCLNCNLIENGFYMSCGAGIHFLPSSNYNLLFSSSPWQPNKPLEEQSDETIEKIAKILGV